MVLFLKVFAVKQSNNVDIQKLKATNPVQNKTYTHSRTHWAQKTKKAKKAKKEMRKSQNTEHINCADHVAMRDDHAAVGWLKRNKLTYLPFFVSFNFLLFMCISQLCSISVWQANCVALSWVSLCCSARNLPVCRYEYVCMYICVYGCI